MEPMENSAQAAGCALLRGPTTEQTRQRHRLYALYQQAELTDVVLVVQGERLAAHRVVLAAASPFFYALFTSGMKESHAPSVELHEMNDRALRDLLVYMYVGHLPLTGETILPVLVTANQLEMLEVVEMCAKQLMLELNVTNCVDIYLCCKQLKMRAACRTLARAALAMVETYFSVVCRTESFKSLPLTALMKILLRRKISIEHDGAALVGWLLYDPRPRQLELAQMFTSLRMAGSEKPLSVQLCLPNYGETESDQEEEQEEKNWQLVQANVASTNSGMVNSRDRLPSSLQTLLLSDEDQQQQKQSLMPTIFVIGGFNGPSALKTVEYLDFHSDEWFQVASMQEKRSYSGVVVTAQNQIVVMGGTSNARHLKTMEVYDPERDQWDLMPPMRKARSYMGAVYADGYIYVVGGFNGLSHLSSVERFDVETQVWEELPSLNIGRSGLAVVLMHGLIYAIGGYDGRKHLKSVEVFDPACGTQWMHAPSMRYARNGPAAVAEVSSNSILVFGGESRHGVRMNMSERLELPPHSEKDEQDANMTSWQDVDAFEDCRSGHVALSFLQDSFLFCLGGSNKKDEYLDTVHRYDHLTKEWSLHSHMRTQRCGLNVAVVQTSTQAACFHAQKQSTAVASSSRISSSNNNPR